MVVYYSQSGQLTEVVHSILAPLKASADISLIYEEIKPKKPFPFPWTSLEFCDVFPESIAEIPCDIEPLSFDSDAEFDLVILAYQVWYLAPSTPVTAFIKSPAAKKILRNRPVITIIGCRNMWLLAQEKVKRHVYDLGGELIGNIVLGDRTANLIGVITIAAWMLTGETKRLLGIFPHPGISTSDIKNARRFGHIILKALSPEFLTLRQSELNQQGAVTVVPAYIIFENRIHKIFNVWSRFIRREGGPGSFKRKARVRLFMGYLVFAILLLAPLASVLSSIIQKTKKEKLQKEIEYYSQNLLRLD